MSTLDQIRQPVAKEMDLFEDKFKTAMQSRVPLLDRITRYIVKRKGKQIRPLFVFLSAGMLAEISEATHRGAALVELLHTATLVHDDVVDDAYERRGFFSINALWKNKIAVLVGDYLLSKGLLLSLQNKEFHLLEITSDAVRRMSEGELLQIEKARRLDITEEVYFEIISNKTASLIASCCAVGVASVNQEADLIERARQFGEKVGLAFQIKDDLLDLGDDPTGKTKGVDIKEKKMTLPLIYALSKCESSEKRRIISIIKNHNENPKKVAEVVRFIHESGGIAYAHEVMRKLQAEADALLMGFPNNVFRESLQQLVAFTVDRNK
ncbi:MAG: polyprenyl synthetase family protein [Sphingobacteriaceae bacterium]|nr:polyprenyl synthetase family protein [Sphingobacteriaceae bacterium]